MFNDMSGSYDGIAEQYIELAGELGKLGLLYLHLVDHSAMGAPKPDPVTVGEMCRAFRQRGGQAVILSGGYDVATGRGRSAERRRRSDRLWPVVYQQSRSGGPPQAGPAVDRT